MRANILPWQGGQLMDDKQKFLIGMYLGAIIVANLVVAKWGLDVVVDLGGPIGQIQVVFFTALLLIGLDLTSRDFLHELWKEKLWENMLKLIVAGSLLSLVVNFALAQAGWGAPWEIVQNIAIASTIAFFCAGLADTFAYQLLGEQERLLRINGSNVASGFVDSLIFPTLAFGILAGAPIGEAILWSVTAQMTVAKIIGGFLWAFGIVELAKRLDLKFEQTQVKSTEIDRVVDNTTVFVMAALSFFIPFAGFLVGAFYSAKKEEHAKSVGKTCLIMACLNIIVVMAIVIGSLA